MTVDVFGIGLEEAPIGDQGTSLLIKITERHGISHDVHDIPEYNIQ